MHRGIKFSRRTALGALATAPTLLSQIGTAAAEAASADRELVDIAVVGGGVAGAYCCWRLQATGRQPVLFEMSDRIGGRLLSKDMSGHGLPNVFGELGGMRFLTTQQMVHNLITHLRLAVSDFPVAGENNFATLRNRMLKNADYKQNPALVPYRLLPTEERRDPGELLIKAITTVIPSAASLTPQQWEDVKQTSKWNGDYLYNWGLWNVLLSTDRAGSGPVLSSEAYDLLYDGGGYQSLVDNWNCAEAFEYLLVDFPSSAQYKRLTYGYQKLPEKLANEFKQAGGKINMQHRLEQFVPRSADGSWVVDLDVFDEKNRVRRRYRAKALILAMPQRSLEMITPQTPTLNEPAVQELLKSVQRMPAFKALVVYPRPWWRKRGVTAGRSTTDLPVRQVYYMESASGPATDSESIPETPSLLLATYADGRAENFWRPLLWEKADFPMQAMRFKSGTAVNPEHMQSAPRAFTDTLHALLAQMHHLRMAEIPDPVAAPLVKDWSENPYGGGWHFWQPKVKVWETMPRVRQPIPQTPVHICGEAYANQQGWVEGALTSAEHVLQDHFKLSWPSWLPKDYFLGP
jgi:monoamine oxidase